MRSGFSPDLLKQPWRSQVEAGATPATGHCYAATEACYHLLGGRQSGWRPRNLRHEGSSHWFLHRDTDDALLDATADQFAETPDYTQGRGCGFLTGDKPSKRARTLIERAAASISS